MLHGLQRGHINHHTCSRSIAPLAPRWAESALSRRRRRCAVQTAAAASSAAPHNGAHSHPHPHPHPQQQPDSVAVYAISDLHVDHAANLAWVARLPAPPRAPNHVNALIVAGDVSHDLGLIEQTLRLLRARFDRVVFVAGNHEAWVHAPAGGGSGGGGGGGDGKAAAAPPRVDSVAKLAAVDQLCGALGVDAAPVRIGPVWLAPLLAWHERAWDEEPDVPGLPPASALTVGDYRKCKWPARVPGAAEHGARALAEWVDALNDGGGGGGADGGGAADDAEASLRARRAAAWAELWADVGGSSARGGNGSSSSSSNGSSRRRHVISISHFLPLQQLLPEKRFLSYPPLAKAVGSAALAARVARLRPDCHVFGHSHFAWDCTLGATRYVQAPLCYPSERARRAKSIRVGAAAAAWRRRREAAIAARGGSGSGGGDGGGGALLQHEHRHEQQHQQQQQHDSDDWVDDLPVLLYVAHKSNSSSSSSSSGSSSGTCEEWAAEWAPCLEGAWSEYYVSNARTPWDTELAPWVAKRYAKRLAAHRAAHRAAASASATMDASEDTASDSSL